MTERHEHGDEALRRELAETQARYQALVEQIPAILYEDVPTEVPEVLDSTYVGPQIDAILGITPKRYIEDETDQWVAHLHPDDRERAISEYRSAVASGGPLVQEYRWVRDDGRIVWLRDQFTVVHDDEGNVICVQGVMFDVTELKEAERAISGRVELQQKVDLIGRGFTDLVLQGSDLQQLLDGLVRIVGGTAVLEDGAHQPVAFAGTHGAGEPDELLRTWDAHSRLGHEEEGTGVVHVEPSDPPCTWIPIVLRGRAWGRMHVLATEPLGDVDRLALDRAAAAVALTLHSEQHVAHLADHERGALMSDIWEGRFASAQEILGRARRLGADLEGRHLAALVVEPVTGGDEERDLAEDDRRRARSILVRETRAAMEAERVTGLSAIVGDRVLAIIGVDKASIAPVRAIGERVCERLATQLPSLVVSVGISAATEAAALRQALAQADEAAAYGGRDARRSGVHTFEDLGIRHLLLRLADGPELAHFVEAQLAPLLNHDAKSSSELLPTLRAYLANGGRKAETARALHLERRSLYYRLERIENLLEADLDDPETRIQLEIAARGLDLLRQRAGVSPA